MHICGQLVKFVESDDCGRPLSPKGVHGEGGVLEIHTFLVHVTACLTVLWQCVFISAFSFLHVAQSSLSQFLSCALTVLTHFALAQVL